MYIYSYKGDIQNFGDDLNDYLWIKLFPDIEKRHKNLTFIGIGSVLDSHLDMLGEKVVFGSGVRRPKPIFEKKTCKFFFVRGPLSARAVGRKDYITDSAYCLKFLNLEIREPSKKYSLSIIPYFRHLKIFNWKRFERITGIHIIDISSPVENVINEIRSSKRIISGAMHGAIVADLYRIPWARLKFGKHGYESFETSDLKWKDWTLSMEIENFPEVEVKHKFLKVTENRGFFDSFKLFAILYLKILLNNKFALSNNDILNKRTKQLEVVINEFSNFLKNSSGINRNR